MEPYFGPHACLIDQRTGVRHDSQTVAASVARRARELAEKGVLRGDRVVLAHNDGCAFIIDLLATWSCAATAVAVSHGIVDDERRIVREKTSAKAWIGASAPPGAVAFAPAELGAGEAGELPFLPRLDDAALIMMTSGTTGDPKGVVLTHRAIQARLALNLAHMGHEDLAVALTVLPMHFGHGLIGNTLTPLAAGASLVVWPEPGPTGLQSLGKVVDKYGVTFMSSVPSLWRVALKLSAPPTRATLRRIHVGSAPLAASLWEEIIQWSGTRRVVNMYGITETANWIAGYGAEDGPLDDGLVGRPWGGNIRLRDEHGRLSSTGRGEIMVNSPSLMSGYFDRPDLTGQSLDGSWFRTGDIGELDESGLLRLVGRSKHEINLGGIKIPAEEIDALLERHPSIVEACAFALPDTLSGELVAAAVVAADGELELDALRDWCETRIRREAVPSRLFLLPALPRTDRGKLNRDLVRSACIDGLSQGARP